MLFLAMYITAAPAQLNVGDSCQLNHALAVEIKRGKKKKTEAVAKGETLKVIELGKREASVEGKLGRGAVNAGDLMKFCVLASTLPPVEVVPASAPASAPAVTELFVPKKTTSVTIGALVMPPNTKKEIFESVQALILEVIRTSGTLHFDAAPEQSEKAALECVQSNACLGERAKNVGAEYAIGAWMKAEKNRGVLDFRLVDASGQPGNATLRSINDPGEVDTETVTALKAILRGMIPEDAGMLVLQVNEVGVEVKVDGTSLGKTPLKKTKLRTGAHDVVLEKARFVAAQHQVMIEPGKDNYSELWIEPKPDYKSEFKRQNGLLRSLAWSGVGVGIAATVAAFSLRIAANRIEDGLKNDYARLDAMYAGLPDAQVPREEYQAVARRSGQLPLLDGLTWTAGAIAVIGAATAVTCFIIGDDPKRYDHKKVAPERDLRLSVGVGAGNLALHGEF